MIILLPHNDIITQILTLVQYQCLSKKTYIKYLGVTIDNKLSFKQHIAEKCKSATKVLNLVKRNLHFAPKSVKCKAYVANVRPILEYASICWNPTSDKQSHDIELIQNKAAKFVTNTYPRKGNYHDFSVTRLIKQLGWISLEERRNQARLSMMFKIRNNQVIIEPESLPTASKTRPTRTCQEKKVGKLNQLFERESVIQNSGKTFFYMGPKLWNDNVLPAQASAPNIEAFKSYFSK